MSTEFYLIAAIAVTVLSAGRLTRLGVVDHFPPAAYIRAWYLIKFEDSEWRWLAKCVFCFSLYPTALVFVTGLLAHVYSHPPNADHPASQVWWIVNGLLALTYLSAMSVARDGSNSEDD